MSTTTTATATKKTGISFDDATIEKIQQAGLALAAIPRNSAATVQQARGIARIIGDAITPIYKDAFEDTSDIDDCPEQVRWLIVAAKFTLGMHELFIVGDRTTATTLTSAMVDAIMARADEIKTVISTIEHQ